MLIKYVHANVYGMVSVPLLRVPEREGTLAGELTGLRLY